MGLEEGRLMGFEEGKLQMETTVVNLFKRGMDIPLIAEILQIEQEEIERVVSSSLI
jgi:predicted transposase YdaD